MSAKNIARPIPDHLDAVRVAALLDMSTRWVKNMVHKGELKGYRIGGRIKVDGDSLRAFLAAREVSSSPE